MSNTKKIFDLTNILKELRELSISCEDIAQDLYDIYKQISDVSFVCKCGEKLKFDYSLEVWYCSNCNRHYELEINCQEVEL